MMKTYLYLSVCLFILGLTSCYEDESSVNNKLVNPIVIDLGDNGKYTYQTPTYTLFSLDTLEIKPIVYKEGIVDTNLSFTWTLQGNNISASVIGNKMTLKTCITAPAESNAYQLVFDVEDRTSSIHAQQLFDIKVESPFGVGLLVGDSKDEQNSDVSLIMSYHFNYSLKPEQTKKNYDLFSLINGHKIPYFPINGLHSTTYGTNRSLTITTPQSIDRVDPFNFNYIDGNGDVFVIDPGKYNPEHMNYLSNMGIELLIMGGKVYPRSMSQMNKYYSYYLLTNDKELKQYYVSHTFYPPYEYALAFDKQKGRMLELTSGSKLSILTCDTLDPNLPFNPNKLQNFDCKGMCIGANRTIHTILQDKNNGKIYSYVTVQGDGKAPQEIIDLSGCENIRDAIAFTSVETQSVIYYATKDKIYSVYYRGNQVTTTPEYEAPENNEILLIDSWREGSGKIDYANPDPNAEDKKLTVYNQNRMIVIATYDTKEHEGFIRTVAITTVGTGTLEKDYRYHGEYGGFGKITAFSAKLD